VNLGSVTPVPSEDEAAAIVAALEAFWPRPVTPVVEPTRRPSTWRFSGRWWSRPVTARRDRPWY
jgi:hypothetical protein